MTLASGGQHGSTLLSYRALHAFGLAAWLAGTWLASEPAAAQSEFPQTTFDGLERVASERADALYWRPNATLAPYKRVALLDCSVAFVKDWENTQDERRGFYKADAEDMARIRAELAQEFRNVFTQELEAGGYEVVDAVGSDVLQLKPAIVNLDVTAPALDVPGNVVNYVETTGEMTLHLELYDSATNALIGRAIDRAQGSPTGGIQISDTVKNREDADRILRSWARALRDALDAQWTASR